MLAWLPVFVRLLILVAPCDHLVTRLYVVYDNDLTGCWVPLCD